MQCVQCNVKTRKYKCSKCLKYRWVSMSDDRRKIWTNLANNEAFQYVSCSFDCYKTHKTSEACVNAQLEPSVETLHGNETSVPTSRINVPFSTDDTVDPAKLAELGEHNMPINVLKWWWTHLTSCIDDFLCVFSANSEALKDLLKNKHLRQFLREVDSAENAFRAIKAAMMEPLFVEFADECINIIEPDTWWSCILAICDNNCCHNYILLLSIVFIGEWSIPFHLQVIYEQIQTCYFRS